MWRRLAGLGGVWLFVLGLNACSTSLPPPPADQPHFGGRFSLVVNPPEGDHVGRQVWNGGFSLTFAPARITLDLNSPLGSSLARFQTDPGGATLSFPHDGQVQVEHGANAQALAQQWLGWSLPLDNLPFWLAGQPDPSRPFQVLPPDAPKVGVHFFQDDWEIKADPVEAGQPPRRLSLLRPALSGQPAMTLRVILDQTP